MSSTVPHTAKADNSKHKESFCVEWETPGIRTVSKAGVVSDARSNFAMELLSLVEGEDKSGYLARVKQIFSKHEERVCFFTKRRVYRVSTFMSELNSSYGCGGMMILLSARQLSAFIQYLERQKPNLAMVQAASNIGYQADGVCIISKDLQISAAGEVILREDWTRVFVPELLGIQHKFEIIIPKISLPLSTSLLHRLLTNLQVVMEHNFIPCMLMIGGMITSFHSSALPRGGCPVVAAFGGCCTGKTASMKIALSLIGNSKSYYGSITESAALFCCSKSSIPFGIDNSASKPKNGYNMNNIIHQLSYSDNASCMGKLVTLKALPLIITEYPLHPDERLCVIPFKRPALGCSFSSAEREVMKMQNSNQLSSVIGWVVKQRRLVTDQQLQEPVRQALSGHFSGRRLNYWTLIGLAALEFLQEGGLGSLEIHQQVIEYIKSVGAQECEAGASGEPPRKRRKS